MTRAPVISLVLHGANGRMGRSIQDVVAGMDDVYIAGVLDYRLGGAKVDLEDTVVIDFSSPGGLDDLLERLPKSGVRLVSGTTGLNSPQRDMLEVFSENNAVFYDENMSYGISVLKLLIGTAGSMLRASADVEIVEYHHRAKRDHPSGTALSLAKVLAPESSVVSGRGDDGGRHPDGSVHVHSVRAGGIPGEHHVVFASDDEVVTLSHKALSRDVFARGAVEAARFLTAQGNGLFSMEDLVRSRQ